jgi:hypothetical protein
MRLALLAVAAACCGAGVNAGVPADVVAAPGIAAGYPGDAGIGADPRVIFADAFESYDAASDLDARWSARYHNVSITRDLAHVHAGAQAVEMLLPRQEVELSNGIAKVLARELDVLHLRYYSKFDTTFDVTGSSHNGGGISARYFDRGRATPGVRADGTNKFLVEFENWRDDAETRSPGEQNVYVYHPGQRSDYGDHFFPDGRVLPGSSIPGDFGPGFVARPNVIPELGRWYSFELMLRANTPGLRDGRVSAWIDGVLVADFPGLRLRDIGTLAVDRFGLSLHARSNPAGATRKWYDDVVAATEYIGPMR